MKNYIILLMMMLAVFLVACDQIPTQIIETEPTLPNETPFVDYTKFYNSFGFSSLIVTDRTSLLSEVEDVYNEVQFLDALLDSTIKVIRIHEDLSMGIHEVTLKLEALGKSLVTYKDVYREHNRQPLMHPTLIASGIGHIRIVQRNDLMIYSETGIKIKHASFLIDGSSNIVFRNLHMSELWEWDEWSNGKYDRNDWDYFTVQESKGIWFDHLTFDQAYDGIIDVKELSEHLTLSWSKLKFVQSDFIDEQMDYLEENIHDFTYYRSLRDQGISVDDIKQYASFQKKGFNLGNTTDGEGFEPITMTFHHLDLKNLMDRMPRLRKGDVHLYHVILDNEMIYDLQMKLNDQDISFVNQGIVTTEQGNVLMEHSIFRYVSMPIKNHQDSNPDVKYTGSYQVINSEQIHSQQTYFGSSDDKNTKWIHSGASEPIPFHFRNYEELPYQYTLEDVFFLTQTFSSYPTGAQHLSTFDWLKIDESLHVKGE